MARGLDVGICFLLLLLPFGSVSAVGGAGLEATQRPVQLPAQRQAQRQAQVTPGLDEPIQPHPTGDAAIQQLRSPFCPGLMLEVCPTTQAKLLRDSLQMMAWDGASSDSIIDWMLTSYGEEYRGVPLTSGGGLWAWLMPPIVLLAGFLAVAVALRHFRRTQEVHPSPATPLSEEDETILAAALQELRASEEVPF